MNIQDIINGNFSKAPLRPEQWRLSCELGEHLENVVITSEAERVNIVMWMRLVGPLPALKIWNSFGKIHQQLFAFHMLVGDLIVKHCHPQTQSDEVRDYFSYPGFNGRTAGNAGNYWISNEDYAVQVASGKQDALRKYGYVE